MNDPIGQAALFHGFKRVEGIEAVNCAVKTKEGNNIESTRYEGGKGYFNLYYIEKAEAMSKAESFSGLDHRFGK